MSPMRVAYKTQEDGALARKVMDALVGLDGAVEAWGFEGVAHATRERLHTIGLRGAIVDDAIGWAQAPRAALIRVENGTPRLIVDEDLTS